METKEVLRQWLAGAGNKRIAARVGVDVKTVRRYVSVARSLGLEREQGEAALTEELLTTVLASLHARPGRQRGEAWAQCEAQREFIAQRLAQGLKLSKLRKLLQRQGVQVPYPTLHRFAVAELNCAFRPMTDTIPNRWRTPFRRHGGQCSDGMADTLAAGSEGCPP